MPHATPSPTILDVDSVVLTGDAAHMLGVSPATVRDYERTGRLTAIRTIRGLRLFSKRDVERLRAEREQRRTMMQPAGTAA
jgi:excisionase family DNA binding protein